MLKQPTSIRELLRKPLRNWPPIDILVIPLGQWMTLPPGRYGTVIVAGGILHANDCSTSKIDTLMIRTGSAQVGYCQAHAPTLVAETFELEPQP